MCGTVRVFRYVGVCWQERAVLCEQLIERLSMNVHIAFAGKADRRLVRPTGDCAGRLAASRQDGACDRSSHLNQRYVRTLTVIIDSFWRAEKPTLYPAYPEYIALWARVNFMPFSQRPK